MNKSFLAAFVVTIVLAGFLGCNKPADDKPAVSENSRKESEIQSDTDGFDHKVPIAVSGMIDLDGDGKSDRRRLEGLVRQNGGVMVARHDEAGNRRGEINASTRFLVVGESKSADPNDLDKVMESISHFDRQANELGVQKISLKRFLNLIGVPNRGQIEPLDKFVGTEPKPKFQQRSAFDK